MKIGIDQLKQYIDVAGINGDGFEAVLSAGLLTTNVMNNDRNVALVIEMPTEDGGESKFRMQREIALKYLKNIDGAMVDITSDDTLITVEGENVKVFFPQVTPVIIDKTKKPLPKVIDWTIQSTIILPPQNIRKIIDVADNIGEKILTFVAVDGKITAKVKKTAIIKNVATVDGDAKDFTVSYHVSALKDALFGSKSQPASITIYEQTEQGRPPSSFAYATDAFMVSGLMAEWSEKE